MGCKYVFKKTDIFQSDNEILLRFLLIYYLKNYFYCFLISQKYIETAIVTVMI